MTESDLYTFITHCPLAVLASTNSANFPQTALIGIAVTPDLEIVFDTLNTSRKYANLIAHPACSFVIGWTGEQTVQYEGEAQQLALPELERYQQIYFQQWHACRAHLSWPGIAYFVVKPRWIRFSDYDRNRPLMQEFTFPSPLHRSTSPDV